MGAPALCPPPKMGGPQVPAAPCSPPHLTWLLWETPGCYWHPVCPEVPPSRSTWDPAPLTTVEHHGMELGQIPLGSRPAELHSLKLQKPTPKIFTLVPAHTPLPTTSKPPDPEINLCTHMVPLPLSLPLSLMCQGTLHHLTATSERPGPPHGAPEPPAIGIGGPQHCPHLSPRRGQAQLPPTILWGHTPALTAWSLQDGTSLRGGVWPQGQPLCHPRQGRTTPTHPRP